MLREHLVNGVDFGVFQIPSKCVKIIFVKPVIPNNVGLCPLFRSQRIFSESIIDPFRKQCQILFIHISKGSRFTLPLVGVVKPIKSVCQLKAGLYLLEPKVPAIPVFMVVTKSAESISALVLAVAV